MILTLLVVTIFVLLAILTFFRDLLYGIVDFVLSLFNRKRGGDTGTETTIHRTASPQRKKRFKPTDGEYVEYEEVPDKKRGK